MGRGGGDDEVSSRNRRDFLFLSFPLFFAFPSRSASLSTFCSLLRN